MTHKEEKNDIGNLPTILGGVVPILSCSLMVIGSCLADGCQHTQEKQPTPQPVMTVKEKDLDRPQTKPTKPRRVSGQRGHSKTGQQR